MGDVCFFFFFFFFWGGGGGGIKKDIPQIVFFLQYGMYQLTYIVYFPLIVCKGHFFYVQKQILLSVVHTLHWSCAKVKSFLMQIQRCAYNMI